MNNHVFAAGLVLAIGSNAMAGALFGSASINVDVLAVNGTPAMPTGTVNTVGVMPGDTILFAINATIESVEAGDFIQFAALRLEAVGPFGTVDPDSITIAPALQGFLPGPDGLVSNDNGLNLTTFRLPGNPDNSLGTGGQLFTFEFVVTAMDGEFSYDTLVVPMGSEPDNTLRAGGPDFNKYLIAEITADTIVIPAPSALAGFGLLAGFGAARRRRA